MAEIERIVRDWIGAALVAAGVWAIVVSSIKAAAQRNEVGR
ncbi:MAG TPA: hypothetical protein VGD91_24955 [Trebonia sp.]